MIIGKKSNKRGPYTVKPELIDLDEAVKILSGPNVFVIPPPASELEKIPPKLRKVLYGMPKENKGNILKSC